MKLMVNAIDSLWWSLIHLGDFVKMDPYFEKRNRSSTYLKQAIINLNCCLELLFKKLICDKNELLIYDWENSENEIINYYNQNTPKQIKHTYDYFLLNNDDIITIPYSKCIDLYCKLYNISKAYNVSFLHLNRIRNTIIHLGVNYQEEYYFLVGCINRTLQHIYHDILPTLNRRLPKIQEISDAIFSIDTYLSEIEEKLWKELYEESIKGILKILIDAFNDDQIQQYIKEKRIGIDLIASIEMQFSYASIIAKDENIDEEMFLLFYEPVTNSLIFNDGLRDSTVFAVFSLNIDSKEKNTNLCDFYYSKSSEGVAVQNIDNQTEFWRQPEYKNLFYKNKLEKRLIIALLKMMIDYCDSIEFI